MVTLVTALIIALGSSIKALQLSRGGQAVAEMLGGTPVSPQTTDPEERRLFNVVEEMALASGTPVPAVYVMNREDGINAFAAGHDTRDAVIGVTRGCIHLLTRDELQGVIAHEFSHILNGDMALNMRLTCLTYGIIFIAQTGYLLLRFGQTLLLSGDNSKRQEGGHFLIIIAIFVAGVIILIIGAIGVFFARLIQSAISREREFLADASAVQFTRNPSGIAGALKKIGGWAQGSRIQSGHAPEAAHFFFSRGGGKPWFNWFATHPPLVHRIALLDPSFKGEFAAVTDTGEMAIAPPRSPDEVERGGALGLAGATAALSGAGRAGSSAGAGPVPAISEIPHAEIASAQRFRQSIPQELEEALHDSHGACAIVFLLLTEDEREQRDELLAGVDHNVFPGILTEMHRLQGPLDKMASGQRLALIDLCIPALRGLAPGQFRSFRAVLQSLIEADGQITLFEYALDKVLIRHLDATFSGAREIPVRHRALAPVFGEVVVILSTLARLNSGDPNKAFRNGVSQLNLEETSVPILPPESCSLRAVDQALETLQYLAPILKKNLLYACAQTVLSDGKVGPEEYDLLRAIADVINAPLPPLIHEKI
jgi:Zn-dependent protease with chaperone function